VGQTLEMSSLRQFTLRFVEQRIDASHSYGQITAETFWMYIWNYWRVEL
jgi:hypothetical protein